MCHFLWPPVTWRLSSWHSNLVVQLWVSKAVSNWNSIDSQRVKPKNRPLNEELGFIEFGSIGELWSIEKLGSIWELRSIETFESIVTLGSIETFEPIAEGLNPNSPSKSSFWRLTFNLARLKHSVWKSQLRLSMLCVESFLIVGIGRDSKVSIVENSPTQFNEGSCKTQMKNSNAKLKCAKFECKIRTIFWCLHYGSHYGQIGGQFERVDRPLCQKVFWQVNNFWDHEIL